MSLSIGRVWVFGLVILEAHAGCGLVLAIAVHTVDVAGLEKRAMLVVGRRERDLRTCQQWGSNILWMSHDLVRIHMHLVNIHTTAWSDRVCTGDTLHIKVLIPFHVDVDTRRFSTSRDFAFEDLGHASTLSADVRYGVSNPSSICKQKCEDREMKCWEDKEVLRNESCGEYHKNGQWSHHDRAKLIWNGDVGQLTNFKPELWSWLRASRSSSLSNVLEGRACERAMQTWQIRGMLVKQQTRYNAPILFLEINTPLGRITPLHDKGSGLCIRVHV